MIIIQENQVPLVEMARFKDFGISLEVRSDDHGKLGNKSMPAHAHILDNLGKEIAEIELSIIKPAKAKDIVWYRTLSPPSGLGEKIIKLINSPSKATKKVGASLTIWQYAVSQWITFHEN